MCCFVFYAFVLYGETYLTIPFFEIMFTTILKLDKGQHTLNKLDRKRQGKLRIPSLLCAECHPIVTSQLR